ncbi:MACPF domain-containing protein At1g14780-like [Silene latifolia]|uniref:MACPF domain-containing protein At1g14780-like n=1 Tax=Silene latifolia TaxID=37657 RepID=UPI003D783497
MEQDWIEEEKLVEEENKKSIELRAVESLGLGFDLTSDFRLKFAKRERLVVLNESIKKDIVFPGNVSIPGVSADVRCDKGEQLRFKSDVLQFNQMSELLNQKNSVQGKVPSGYFNAIFNFSGSWLNDVADNKHLAFDGYFVALYHLHLMTSALILHDKVKKSVPSHWDPASLSRFIQTYGTHIIVGLAVGGQDLICVRQAPSSDIPPSELRAHLEDLGDALFSDGKEQPLQRKAWDGKKMVPEVFTRVLQSKVMQLASVVETSNKEGLSVIRSKRGGNVYLHSHSQWLQTVASNPDAILFKFVPITSLLAGIPGSGYLSHAINLYLRYKPAPEDLQYFLEFQVPRQWAPMYNELPLQHQRLTSSSSSLQFSLMGPKIHVNSSKVSSSLKPIVGLRLYLEGKHCNQLAIHAQHLTTLPNSMTFSPQNDSSGNPSRWRGSDEFDPEDQFLEHIRWKRFSKVCTSIVKHDEDWLTGKTDGVFIVTGAQLIAKGRWPKTVLHLRLLFSYLPNCSIRRTEWAATPQTSHKSSILMTLSTTFTFTQKASRSPPKKQPAVLNSGVYPNGPPVPINCGKLLKYIDTSEVLRGPHDAPGHWLVTAARLVLEGGKLGLHVKFALIDYTNDM